MSPDVEVGRRGSARVRSFGARCALAGIRLLAPVTGEPRAQWVVGRAYALAYLVRYYLSAQYAKASLGMLWVAIAPLLLVAVYLPIFLFVFKAEIPGRSPFEYALFCLTGLMVWAAFSDALGQGAGALVQNASIVRHAPTPPIMLPLVKVLGSFGGLTVGLAILCAVLCLSGGAPGARVLLLPIAFVLALGFTIGVVLLLAIAAAYVRDVLQILPTLLAIEFFAAPVVYAPSPLGKLSANLQFAVGLNPLSPFLALFRAALLPWHPFAWSDLWLALAWTVGALAVGGVVFRRLETGLGDVV